MSYFFFTSRRRHTRWPRDWSSNVCSSDLVVALEQETALGNVGDENVMTVAVVDIADRDRHAAFGVVLEARARQLEALALVIEKQFLRPVVVREVQIGPSVVVEVRSRGRERPARASHAQRIRDVLKGPVTHVLEQEILT